MNGGAWRIGAWHLVLNLVVVVLFVVSVLTFLLTSLLEGDPAILLAGETGDSALVRSAVLSAAFGTVAYPFVIDLDNDVLRAELHHIMHRLVFDTGRPPRN